MSKTQSISLSPVAVSGTLGVSHAPGAVDLESYPLLAYAPATYGPDVWTEDAKASVPQIVEAHESGTTDLSVLASRFDTTVGHVAEAIRYAAAVAR